MLTRTPRSRCFCNTMPAGAIPAVLILVLGPLSGVSASRSARRVAARWHKPADGIDAHVRRWFQGLRQADNPMVSCCGEADAYEADILESEGGALLVDLTCVLGASAPPTKIQREGGIFAV